VISFAAPWALVGLLAAGIPLLLHLVRRHEAPEVVFPAVRYLEDATRQQQRRLKLRHWLLLLLRTLLVVALVLAAAGMTLRRRHFGPHPPGALVVVLDNSVASAAVVDGEPLLRSLADAARQVLGRATAADQLWLIAADGVVRAGTADLLRRRIGELGTEPVRLDLGHAITAGRELIRTSRRVGQVVVITALQRSALGAAAGSGDLLVLRPRTRPALNRAVTGLTASAQPWSPGGGRVTVTVSSSDTAPVPVTLAVGGRTLHDVLVVPGVANVARIGPQPSGWTAVTATLPPDELRLDDSATLAVRVAPPAEVAWDSTDRYIEAAAQVLAADGRIRAGNAIHLGSLGAGTSIVVPPEDPAMVGALDRTLAATGSGWSFGSAVESQERTDSGAMIRDREPVIRRYSLQRTGSGGDVLATVDGAPWVVRSGHVILIGSRLEPAWTGLPLSASFVPFLDALLTSVARGELTSSSAVVGQAVNLPERATAVAHDGITTLVPGGSSWTPHETGIDYVLAGGDTLGAITVAIDPRASDLARATDNEVRALWPEATVRDLASGSALAFAFVGASDVRGLLLVLAVLCAVAEAVIAGRGRRAG